MALLSDFDWSFRSVAKVIGVALLGVLALTLIVVLVTFTFRTIVEPLTRSTFDSFGSGQAEMSYDKATSSVGIVPPMPPQPPEPTVQEEAERYEVREHSVTYRTRAFDGTCGEIAALKSRADIVFESSNRDDDNCSFTFKAKKEKAEEVIALLRNLDPENFNTNVFTIQQIIEDQTDELAIQTEKLRELEKALREAQASYDELSRLATGSRDIEALTQLVDLKINTISRLAQERLAASTEVDRITRARAEQMERLVYETFHVSVYRVSYADLGELQQSWQGEVKSLIANLNDVLQALTIGLVTLLIRAVQAVVYVLLAIVIARGVWAVGRRIWVYKK